VKRSTILGIFLAVLILLVFGLSVYLFISRINKETMFASPIPLVGSKKVAVVEIIGVISDSKSVIEKIVKFRKNDSVKAVVVRIDSPGGAVGPAQEIYERG
jgi:protease-4